MRGANEGWAGEREREKQGRTPGPLSLLSCFSHPPPRFPPPISEIERQARIKEEGWDRFAPVSETNKPPAGAPRPKKKDDDDEEDDSDDDEEDSGEEEESDG